MRDAGRFTLQCQDLRGRPRKKTKQRQKAHNREQTQKHEKCEDHLLTVGCVSTHYLKIPAHPDLVLFPIECWSETPTWQDLWSPKTGHLLSWTEWEGQKKMGKEMRKERRDRRELSLCTLHDSRHQSAPGQRKSGTEVPETAPDPTRSELQQIHKGEWFPLTLSLKKSN